MNALEAKAAWKQKMMELLLDALRDSFKFRVASSHINEGNFFMIKWNTNVEASVEKASEYYFLLHADHIFTRPNVIAEVFDELEQTITAIAKFSVYRVQEYFNKDFSYKETGFKPTVVFKKLKKIFHNDVESIKKIGRWKNDPYF